MKMTNVTVFLVGVGSTGLAALCAVTYLTPSLRKVLTELCGTAERANFWTAFSNLALILMPLVFALHQIPESNPEIPLVFQLGRQLEWALGGLVVTVLLVGLVISRFIPRPRGISVAAGLPKPTPGAIGEAKPHANTIRTPTAG
jgi:hypothetical protein